MKCRTLSTRSDLNLVSGVLLWTWYIGSGHGGECELRYRSHVSQVKRLS